MIIRFLLHHPLLVDVMMLIGPLALTLYALWLSRRHRPAGKLLALLSFITLTIWLYGRYIGSIQFEVTHMEYANSQLPAAFDGYRIVQFSDAHVGSMGDTRRNLLQEVVDTINALRPDLIVFTGDMQNIRLREVFPHAAVLSQLKATDGVMAVLGNHDYTMYMTPADSICSDARPTCTDSLYAAMGWQLLRNDHRTLHRDTDSIVITGMENDGEGRFPQLGDPSKALLGVGRDAFVVMLEHDPTSWRRRILPHTHCQLTLSGHTHGGQVRLFGWSPASLRYPETQGFYREGDRALYVTRGLGGAIPFRLGCPGEITVITLRKK